MSKAALRLPGDGPPTAPTLSSHLTKWAGEDAQREALAHLVLTITQAAIPLADRLAMARLPGDPAAIVGSNENGDQQKALDVGAHHHLIKALRTASVQHVLSEEKETIETLSSDGLFDVVMDPIDGSDSIGIGASLGLLFAVFPAGDGFDRSGRSIIAAGYVHFGHCIEMGFSIGNGLSMAAYDRLSDVFRVTQTSIQLAPDANCIAFNASNVRRWPRGLQRYLGAIAKGEDGPRGRDFNMRWLAAAVGELHRIIERGGLFMYPADPRPGYQQGRLRLLYEAFPIAWLLEQAGGVATDGKGPILDRRPASLHENTPLFFGAKNEMAILMKALGERTS